MTRHDYLNELEGYLKGRLSRREIDDILRDYAEYFSEGAAQGKTDTEIAMKIGFARDLADQIIGESQEKAQQTGRGWYERFRQRAKDDVTFKALIIILIVILSPLWLSVLGTFLGCALAVIGAIFGVAVALLGVVVALIAAGISLVVAGLTSISFLPATHWILLLVMGLGLLALGICLFCLSLLAVKGISKLCKAAKKRRMEAKYGQTAAVPAGNGKEAAGEETDKDLENCIHPDSSWGSALQLTQEEEASATPEKEDQDND